MILTEIATFLTGKITGVGILFRYIYHHWREANRMNKHQAFAFTITCINV